MFTRDKAGDDRQPGDGSADVKRRGSAKRETAGAGGWGKAGCCDVCSASGGSGGGVCLGLRGIDGREESDNRLGLEVIL